MFLTKIDILNLPSINIDDESSGIYFLFDEKDLIYVGISKNMQLRIMSHKNTKKFIKSSIILDSINNVKHQESWYIFNYLPKYNKVISEDSLYVNINLIKNINQISPLDKGFKLIGGIIYVDRKVVLDKGFGIITKYREYSKERSKKYYELKIL